MAITRVRLGAALISACLLAGCGTSNSIEDVEQVLVEQYLDPLADAGIATSVQRACRYAGPVDSPWHLSIELRLDASKERVADFLEDKGISLRRDREPIVVQQIPGNPGDGWNGSLIGAGNSATLTLVYNNATRDGWPGVVGWAEVCPAEPVTAA